MTKQKHKSKLYLFSLGLLPLLMMGNISGENLLKNIAGTSEPKAIIAQTGLLADGYYRYKDDSIGVEFGDRNSGETQSVTFLSAPATEKIDNYSRPKSISWKIIDPSDQNTGWLQKLTTKIANNLGGRFATTNWKIDGDQAVLHEVLPDVDLRYKILPGLGLKEELIVKGAKEQVEEKYSFNLVTEQGLKLQKASEDNQFNLEVDSYYFTDTRGNYVAHFLPLTVYDSNGQSSNGASLDITNNGDNDFKITITVDHDWLYSVDRQYPIFIDPTIVHDDLTDFNTGNAMNRVKAVAGPKVQLENQELAADVSTVGLWHMNETSGSTVTDFSGNGNNGTATGTTIVDGKLDKARGFNGTSDLINLGKNPSIKGSSQVTIEGWVYPTSLTNYFPIYFESNNTSGYTRLMLNIGTNGALNLAGRDTDGTPAYITYATSATGLIATNKWYHVAGVYNADTDTHRVYINGIDVTSSGNVTAASFPNTAPADDIYLGFATGGNYASGTLDEIRLTKRALSIEEIKADASLRPYGVYTSDVLDLDSVNPTFNNINWTENGVRTSDGETDLSTASLVAQWNFNETSGTTASVSAGSCGTSCNGTLTNMTTTGQDVAVNSGWTVNNKRWGAGALMFDGTNDLIVADTGSAVMPSGTANVTISSWVKWNSVPSANQVIFGYGGNAFANGYLLQYETSQKLEFYISGVGRASSSITPIAGRWYYLVGTYDHSKIKFYIDGQLVAQTDATANIVSASSIRHGNEDNRTYYLNGVLDSLSVYSRALPVDEILSNYQAGNVQLQTRTGSNETPDDGSWEEWRPAGSGVETQILNIDTDSSNWNTDEIDVINIARTNETVIKQEGSGSLKISTGAAQTDANTVGLWHLDETGGSGAYIKDGSGNSNHGTPTGTSVVSGISNKARSFNGSSDYISVPDSSTLDLASSALTLEVWFKRNTTGVVHSLVSKGGNGEYAPYVLNISSDNTIYFLESNTGSNWDTLINSSTTITDNKWHYLVATNNLTTAYLYLDGIQIGSDTSPANSHWNNSSILTIGAENKPSDNTKGRFLNGSIDEVKISNMARSANEIAETYRLGRDHRLDRTITSTDLSNKSVVPFYVAADKPGTYLETIIGESAFANYESDSNTVGLWHLEEQSGSGTYIKDSSSYANHGTPTGTTFVDGRTGKGRKINSATNDYVSINSSTSLNVTEQLTLQAWIYPTSYQDWDRIVSKAWSSDADPYLIYGLFLGNDNDGLEGAYFQVTRSNIGGAITAANSIPLNTWTLVTGTYDGSVAKIYINGTLANSSALTGTINTNSQPVYIGKSSLGNGNNFNGTIDEVRIDNIARTADEIRQAYEIGSRTHTVTIDFAASLDNGNLISDSSDTSFTIDATQNGLSQKGSNLFVGDKIIVRENYDGTEYVAQGLVDSVNISTGAVTISSWDSGATFPSGGYTIKADVFKWQREYFDITSSMSSQRDAVTHITTRFTNGSEGRSIWLDDFKSVSNYLTNPIGSTITSSPHRYFQYRLIPTTTNIQTTPSVAAVTLDYEKSNMTISGGSTTQTSLNNSNKQSFDITVTGVTCDEVDTTITAQVSWNQVDWYEVDQTISPVTNLNITNNINLTTMNGYPATEGNVTFYLRAQTALTTSNTESLTILKDTVNPIVANITSVAGDINTPFNDTTNNGSTLVVYATSDDANTCKWDESDLTYGAMSHYCESTTNCTLNLTGYGDKDVYMRCKDNVGNENNDLLSPTPTFSYTIGGISMDSAVTDEAFLNNNNKNNFGLKGNNVIYETTGGNVVLQGSWNQADWYDVTTVASPVNGETVSGTADVASWNGYPADGDVTVYLRVKGGTSEYSEIRSFLTTKDTTEAGVTGIVSVAGDSDLPFVDPTNNLNTQVLYTASADAASCKWDTNSALTFTEMTNTCEGTSSCTLDLEGRGNHTVYFKCQDIHGNNQTNKYTLTYSINSSSEQPLGWLQTRAIKIDPATPLADYQVRVELTPTTFDYDNTKSDGSDIKFYDDNDTKLEYWTEEWDNRGTSVFWVKVPVGGTEKIYLYYGNYSGTNESNYDDVFSKNNNTSGLVAGWHLDDVVTSSTVSDYSGNNNTGTLTNGPVWVETDGGGWADQSDQHFGTGHHLSFDGNDDYINVPHSTIVDPQTAWTLETWVNRNYLGSQNSLIEKYAWTSGTGGYAMRITADNKLNGFIVNGTAAQACTGTTNIMNGEWYHVAVTFDSTTDSIRCYVNGLLDGYNNAATYNSMSSSSVSLKIGARGNDAGSVLNGYLDEPRIYSRALSGGEIRSQFERRQYDANGPQTILGGSRLVSESHTGQTDWLDSNWNYRTGLTVFNNNNVDALNDYQVVFNLDTKYLVDSGKVLSSGNDLRFTDSDGLTLLDYFIHTDLNNVNTRIFIKIPEVGADSQKKIYMYYGNPSAEVASSENALDFYDDFEDGIIDSTKWPTQSTGSYITEENGQIKMIGIRAGNYYLQSPAISSANIHTVIEAQTSTPILPTNGWSPVSWWKSTSSGLSILDHPNTLIGQQTAWHNGLWDSARTAKNVSETHINQLKIKDNFNTSLQTKFSDSYFSDWTVNYFDNSQDSYFIRLGARADNYDPGSIQTMDGRIDWVLARQYTEPEPRVGAYKVAYTSKKGNIESETWYGTIYVEEPVIVNPGATLTIQPGTIIKFNKDAYLLAENSTINAIGLSYDPIYFTSVNDNNRGTIMDNSTGNPAAGDWMGVYAIGNGDNIMKFCDVAYGGKTNELGGINYRGMINVREDDMTIVNTVFNNSANADIFTYQANPYVYRNNLGDSPYGLYIDANNQVITHAIEYNSFANTTDTAVYVDNLPNTDNNSGPGLVLRNNDIDETNTGFYIKNMSGDSIRDNNAENTIDARQNAFKNQVGYMCYFDTAAGDCKFDRTSGGEILFDTNSAILEIPNGDEHWMAGSTQIVSWNFNNGSSNGSYVDIYLSPNNGEEFDFTVAANLRCDGSGSGPGCSGTSGSYNWLVSGVPNNEKRLKIVLRDSAGNSLVEDMSDRNFQINLITDELSDVQAGAGAKHTVKFAIPFDWPELVNDSFKISFPAQFDLSELNPGDITASGGDVVWGSPVINSLSNTIVIPFTGTLDDTDGLITFGLGSESNMIINPEENGSYRLTITLHDNQTGVNPAIRRLSTNININDDLAFAFHVPATLQLSIRDITDTMDIDRLRFENPTANTVLDVSHLIKVSTNAHNGYSVTISEDHDLTSPSGAIIPDFVGSNEQPQPWIAPPGGTVNGYYGYRTDDIDLSSGTADRFAVANRWAAAITDPKEIIYYPTSTQDQTNTMTFRLQFTPKQVSGHYQHTVFYTITPNY